MTKKKQYTADMSFLAHVGELRGHLVRSCIALILASIFVAFFWDFIVNDIIMAPLKSNFATFRFFNYLGETSGIGKLYTSEFDISKDLTNLDPSGQITSQIMAILVCGLIVAIPYIIWEIWRFVKPGLNENERKSATSTVFAITLFFLSGILFSYYMLLPLSTQFLFSYDPFNVGNTWTLPKYISLFVQTLLSMGVIFLLPVFVYFFTSIGLLTPTFLKTYRKHAFVVVLVIAAAITPNDILSMIVASIPLWFLYELSVVVANNVYTKQLRKQEKSLTKN
ncbi:MULTISPECIES: twin-arginine translocase subunit TatC [Weeksella]|uniref:Sec-independent protein translocase protein TatC n=1 Tax=Weeksella virosa (strain ATCC 43766 / DSM 16922 / JCM 21250 / CCUG 30538 / CDC 9751 / IAM 14551 / NBRC 16016 / NCTC 11634 / CL345/78) TaxID=865938 RepID=F0P006_WEEVC|nr:MULTISPECIES: twin-arginine translocase subunit TatC [Weeksella]ADX67353.1 Sec-independent periplasmic protein translocase [Weeksella virosa DSM 16922]MDK7374418.1 twin-arginine translocase subunit TatC [Weeksella virosa]MDK7675634.1 twin-arginine translocase subunit TatC [Weeksella virosa]OFM81808.1 translocase [Weeksella sp. HMSC059D05]SUP53640.1 Sec-independent protein translocase protein TatCy [Weeksella virosa]